MTIAKLTTRAQRLETRRGKRPRASCPPVAVGEQVGDGLYRVAGRTYTDSEIQGCFSTPFIVLDDGPDDERSGNDGEGEV